MILLALAMIGCGPAGYDTDTDATDTDDTDTAPVDTGTPPDGLTCGDGVRGGAHEECDATDDADCPGTCSAHCQCPSMPPSTDLALHMIDVWQGDGLLVVSPEGFTMLCDTGDEPEYPSLKRHLRSTGVTALDYTLVSHQHADHMGAMDRVLEDHAEIGVAFDGGGRASSDAFADYRKATAGRRTTVVAGDTLDLGPSVQVDVLHSDVGDRDNENNNSVVIRITYGDVTFLIGGDCESEVCESAIDPGPIDVYKVHHHGSSDSTSRRLLRQMEPALALISTGAGNDYGHPEDSTLDRLADVGAEVWRTDEDGNVVVRSDGANWTVTSDARP